MYAYKNGLYVNLTSQCPTACTFCIKFSWKHQYRSHNLKLTHEPSVAEVLEAAGNVSCYQEVVFCGYGESTYRMTEMRELSDAFRQKGIGRVRLNTVGLGDLINKRHIAPELGSFLDSVCISLNTADPQQYIELHRPLPAFRDKAFESVQNFIRECVTHVPETVVTATDLPGVDIEAVQRMAASLGAQFRLRPYLDNYESM